MNQVNETKSVEKVFEPIVVSRVFKADNQKKGTITAEFKQIVKTISTYQSTKVSNSLEDNLFNNEEFNIEANTYETSETRVAWINVPEKMTLEDVQKRITPECRLQKILSLYPILSIEDKMAIESGLISLEDKARKQLVIYGQNHENAGEIIPFEHEGKTYNQFRRIVLKTLSINDLDTRLQDISSNNIFNFEADNNYSETF